MEAGGFERASPICGLEKVHVEFGIVALAHSLLKVAGIRLETFFENMCKKAADEKRNVIRQLLYFGVRTNRLSAYSTCVDWLKLGKTGGC